MSGLSPTMVKKIGRRLIQIGYPLDSEGQKEDILLGEFSCGLTLMVLKRGPDLCNCCGKPVVRVCYTPKPKLPLRKLFKP